MRELTYIFDQMIEMLSSNATLRSRFNAALAKKNK